MIAIDVRRAVAADARSVAEVVQLAYAIYVPRIGRRPAPMDSDYDEVLRSADVWVAVAAGRIVGVVVARLLPDHLLVENLAVDPSVQGQGVGGRLLAVAERYAVAAGRRDVRLYTNEAMEENLGFYPRRRYRETGRGSQDGFRRVFFAKSMSAG